jgi:hypothetical protein
MGNVNLLWSVSRCLCCLYKWVLNILTRNYSSRSNHSYKLSRCLTILRRGSAVFDDTRMRQCSCRQYGTAYCPATQVWRCGPLWALASPKKFRHSFLSPAPPLHPRIRSTCNAPFWTTSALRVLGFPADIVLWNSPLRAFLRSFYLPFSRCGPLVPSLLILISSPTFRS